VGTLIGSTTNTYDGNNLSTSTDGNGNVTTYTYDGGELVSTVVRANGSGGPGTGPVVSSSGERYDLAGNVTQYTDGDGNYTVSTYDAYGQVLTSKQYDASNTLLGSTTNTYDPNENLLTSKQYDASNTLVGSVTNTYDANNLVMTKQYDGAGTLIGSTTNTYDGNRLSTTTDGDNNVTVYTYDMSGNVQSEKLYNASGTLASSVANTYDANGNVLTAKQYDASGTVIGSTTNTYDPNENLLTSKLYDAGGTLLSSVTNTYDGNNLSTTTDALGNVTKNTYDGGRLMSTTVGYGTSAAATTSYTYDLDGNIASETDANGNVTSFTYNASGQVLTTTTPLGTTNNTYDAVGNRTSTLDPRGRLITYAYVGNRLTTETWYNADSTVADIKTYTYDQSGNRLSASDSSGTYTYTYDGNQLATQTDPNGITLTYGYDLDGNVTSISDSQGGVTTMAYNALGEVTSKTYQDSSTQLRVDFTYDYAGNLTSATRYNDVAGTILVGVTTYTYDGNRLTGIVSTDGASVVLSSYSYSYNVGGQLVSQTANGVTTGYTYDATGQLVQSGDTSYGYDANGNPSGEGTVIGSDNELTSDGVWNYTYDALGNMVRKVGIANDTTWIYTYNDANRLVSAVESQVGTGEDVEEVAYEYDVLGNLLSQSVTSGGTTTVQRYSYAPDGTLYADVGEGGVIQTRYVSGVTGPDTWLARVAAGGVSGSAWLLSDYQGSVTKVVGLSGGVEDVISYDAFGNVASETNAGARGALGFQGGRYDAVTGNWMFGVRQYDPTRRQWTTQDPTGFGGGDANLYRFGGNGPTNATDPSGQTLFVRDKELELWQHATGGKLGFAPVGGGYDAVLVPPEARNWDLHIAIAHFLRNKDADRFVGPMVHDIIRKKDIAEQDVQDALGALYGGGLERPNPNYGHENDRLVDLENGIVSPANFQIPKQIEEWQRVADAQAQLLDLRASLSRPAQPSAIEPAVPLPGKSVKQADPRQEAIDEFLNSPNSFKHVPAKTLMGGDAREQLYWEVHSEDGKTLAISAVIIVVGPYAIPYAVSGTGAAAMNGGRWLLTSYTPRNAAIVIAEGVFGIPVGPIASGGAGLYAYSRYTMGGWPRWPANANPLGMNFFGRQSPPRPPGPQNRYYHFEVDEEGIVIYAPSKPGTYTNGGPPRVGPPAPAAPAIPGAGKVNAPNYRVIDVNGRKVTVYDNIMPEDVTIVDRKPGIPLEQRDGKWVTVTHKADGTEVVFTANGTYDFVVVNGQVRVIRPQELSSHTALAGAGPVEYAGTIKFGSSDGNRGTIIFWNNKSGHFIPRAVDAPQAGLPTDLFKPVDWRP
jgi:RHS repeat-associated protein